jgi:hypothetical protein
MHLWFLLWRRQRSRCRQRKRCSRSGRRLLASPGRNLCPGFLCRNIFRLCQRGDKVVSCTFKAAYFRINLSDYFNPCRHAKPFYRPLSSYAEALPCGNSQDTLLFSPADNKNVLQGRPREAVLRLKAASGMDTTWIRPEPSGPANQLSSPTSVGLT